MIMYKHNGNNEIKLFNFSNKQLNAIKYNENYIDVEAKDFFISNTEIFNYLIRYGRERAWKVNRNITVFVEGINSNYKKEIDLKKINKEYLDMIHKDSENGKIRDLISELNRIDDIHEAEKRILIKDLVIYNIRKNNL